MQLLLLTTKKEYKVQIFTFKRKSNIKS